MKVKVDTYAQFEIEVNDKFKALVTDWEEELANELVEEVEHKLPVGEVCGIYNENYDPIIEKRIKNANYSRGNCKNSLRSR